MVEVQVWGGLADDYITLPQTRQGKRYVLTMVEATTGWLETYPVPHATARNTILGLEKQVLWRHGTPERIESDNGTHFKNGLINTWAREHGIEWIYHIPYHAPAAGKVERCNGLLKTTLKALGGGTFKNWELNLAKATWMVNTRGSINRAGPAQSEPLHTVDGDKVPVVHMKGILGKTVWINPTSSKGRPIRGIVFAQGPGSTWWGGQCGDGLQVRNLTCVVHDASVSAASKPVENALCGDCHLTEWSEWSSCELTCISGRSFETSGRQSRSRAFIVQSAENRENCSGQEMETRLCSDGKLKIWVYGVSAGGFFIIVFLIFTSYLMCKKTKQHQSPPPQQKPLTLAYDGDIDM
ncbi:hypothetical protein DUI87_04714 [Hirundo rustica rustica]|uniref:Integrase catalytic domain-containing protein n=1 Tax=Hirundo rustica rustica TaxID=333673 RepID=A0A3M0KZW7_HIRRU|nr:hypothetical protein DUI87_04714 [Hirundo rustica rustica]